MAEQLLEDYYNVALLYQHSEAPDDLLMAHVLSTIAGYKGDYRGRWLSAASLDRTFTEPVDPRYSGLSISSPETGA